MNDKNQTFARFSMMVGEDGIEKLRNSRVIVFGVGGVGSYTVEAWQGLELGKLLWLILMRFRSQILIDSCIRLEVRLGSLRLML